MGKVIKMIDLLDMIANGEKTPKRIRYAGYIFGRSDDYRYYTFFDEEDYQTNHLMEYVRCSDMNDEVEILDEEDEIDIQNIQKIDGDYLNGIIQSMNLWTDKEKAIIKQQNIILEAVKQLDNKLKEN